jgi:hypothetical protein
MKNLAFIICSMLLPSFLFGKSISEELAKQVALNFYAEKAMMTGIPGCNSPGANLKNTFHSASGTALYYAFEIDKGGFVLISASDLVIPVLAYSFEGTFQREFCNVSSWMSRYEEQIEHAISNRTPQDEVVKNEWKRLETLDISQLKSIKSPASVSPLLVSRWNQDKYYNGECPEDPAGPDGKCYAGCVATAMGQLMNYYRFPELGQGSYTYYHPDYDTLSADFGATQYLWNGMPGSLSTANHPVANLLFHLGVSVDMDYGPDGSGMWNHKAAYSLKTYFKYGPETQYFFRDSTSIDWDSILIVNLDQRKPLYYAGWAGVQSTSGHAFVVDGYQGTDYFHFNWGWGGQSDGYFYLNNLTPGGNNFNYAQEVIPMFPDTVNNVYPGYCNGHTEINFIRGSIEDGSGWNNYQPGSSCSWLINPQDPEFDSIQALKITFSRMDTESGADVVYVYDGDTTTAPLLGVFSGNTLPPVITSTGDKVLIVFETNSTINLGGWLADFEPVFPVYCSGTSQITELSGNISDGSGDKNYINNSLCKWKLLPAGAGSVTLTFTSFSLPDSLDVLRIFDIATNQLLGAFTGTELPGSVTSPSGKMLLMFYTNKTISGQGWEGNYYSSLVGQENLIPGVSDFIISPNPSDGIFALKCSSNIKEEMKISVKTTNGKLIYQQNFQLLPGLNHFSINLSRFPKAVYLLEMSTNSHQTRQKIVIN